MEAGPIVESAPAKDRKPEDKPADLRALEESLQQILGTKVVIRTKKIASKGSIQISFFSYDDFDRILKVIKK
jgi:ParB family chromosome partitioning protein